LRIYFDTSFLVSIYARDANFPKAVSAVPANATKLLTQFGELEFGNALRLRIFRKQASHAEAQLIWQNLQQDLNNRVYEYHPFSPAWLERAAVLSRDHTAAIGTRTLDVVHVASALELQANLLFTFDDLQRSLAKAVRLRVN
jgi:predicted nucleic acid-binding protein